MVYSFARFDRLAPRQDTQLIFDSAYPALEQSLTVGINHVPLSFIAHPHDSNRISDYYVSA